LTGPVRRWLAELEAACGADWPDSFTIEVFESALAWWTAAARALRRGHLVAIDYQPETPD
jgi:hypothetical protein